MYYQYSVQLGMQVILYVQNILLCHCTKLIRKNVSFQFIE